MRKGGLLLLWACVLAFLVGCSHPGNNVEGLGADTPIALLEDAIVYDRLDDDGTLTIGCYDLAEKKRSDVIRIEGFYISNGIPAVIGNCVVLPVTLSTGEHQLLRIDAACQTSEILFHETNTYPMDTVCAMNAEIYMLSVEKEALPAAARIRKYDPDTGNMDLCIEKKYTDHEGEQILAFGCGGGKIYILVNQIGTENTPFVEVYGGEGNTLGGKLAFDTELAEIVSQNGIAEFYCYNDFIFVRNFSDEGAIGKVEENQIKTILCLPNLRMAQNGRDVQAAFYGFFVRGGREFYLLEAEMGALYQADLELEQNESIRSAVANEKMVCISTLDEEDAVSFTTRRVLTADLSELKRRGEAYQK